MRRRSFLKLLGGAAAAPLLNKVPAPPSSEVMVERARERAANPLYAFSGDTDSGMYRKRGEELAFATGEITLKDLRW